MSILGRNVSLKVVAALVAFLVVAALLPVMSQPRAREITLVARDMAFYLEGDTRTPNPTLEVKAGERVRVVLRNEDRGMTHDFAVPKLQVVTDLLRWNESGDVAFEIPDVPGTYEYVCNPHRLMMAGRIVVVTSDS
jgi:plastocyanin